MRRPVNMPRLGMTMAEGVLMEWRVRPGDAVQAGDVLYEVLTDKVNMEVEAEFGGQVVECLVPAGSTVAVGAPVLLVEDGEPDGGAAIVSGPENVGEPVTEPGDRVGMTVSGRSRRGPSEPEAPRRRASPAARRLARERGVDLGTVVGSGPGGRIQRQDVLAASPPTAGLAVGDSLLEHDPFLGPRAVIARRMSEAASIPQVTLTRTVEVSEPRAWRQDLRAVVPSLSLVDFILLAVARVLARHPDLNCWVSAHGIRPFADVHLGYAVDAGRFGLLVPVIRNAHARGLDSLSQERRRLTDLVQKGRHARSDLEGATFTVTNLGPLGVEAFNPLLNPPGAGILGVGRVVDAPHGATLSLSLTFDHRAIDGAPAARVLAAIADFVEDPRRFVV